MLELDLSLELDHKGMHLGSVECIAEIEPAFPGVANIYLLGTTGHFTAAGIKETRILLSETDSNPLLKGIAQQAWEVARLPYFQGLVQEKWADERAGARAAYRYDNARQSEAA